MRPKLIALDLDDTLLRRDKSISGYTRRILRQCKAAGARIVIATSRPYRTARLFLEYIPADAMALHNGAVCYVGDEKLFSKGIPVNTRQELVRFLLNAFPTATLSVEMDDTMYANFDISSLWKGGYRHTQDFAELPNLPSEKIVLGPDAREWAARVETVLPADCYAQLSGQTLLVIQRRSATKWNALRALFAHFGIEAKDAVAFGDDLNDVDMLRGCGMGVAMGNALPEVKEAADAICGDCDEDGVANWLEAHLCEWES